jgi:hypothetical protein
MKEKRECENKFIICLDWYLKIFHNKTIVDIPRNDKTIIDIDSSDKNSIDKTNIIRSDKNSIDKTNIVRSDKNSIDKTNIVRSDKNNIDKTNIVIDSKFMTIIDVNTIKETIPSKENINKHTIFSFDDKHIVLNMIRRTCRLSDLPYGPKWIITIETPFCSIEQVPRTFIKNLSNLLNDKEITFAIYRVYTGLNGEYNSVVYLKFYVHFNLKLQLQPVRVHQLFYHLFDIRCPARIIEIKKKLSPSYRDDFDFVPQFIKEASDLNEIFWVKSLSFRYNYNFFIVRFGLVEKSRNNPSMPLAWKNKL